MERDQELLLAAAKRAENLMNPVDGEFLREHDVSADELAELSNAVSVALAAYAKSEAVDPDLRAQLILVGAAALSDMPDKMIRHALDLLRLEQLRKKLGRA